MPSIDYARYSRNVAMYVRDNCHRKKIRQKNWQDTLGFTKQAVMAWKRGDSFPSFENLLSIAAYFKEDIDSIVGWGSRYRPE